MVHNSQRAEHVTCIYSYMYTVRETVTQRLFTAKQARLHVCTNANATRFETVHEGIKGPVMRSNGHVPSSAARSVNSLVIRGIWKTIGHRLAMMFR